MRVKAAAARVAAAAVVYSIALAGAIGVGCAAPGFSCRLSPDANPVASVAGVGLVFFLAGLALMAVVLGPAAMLLRRIGWLYGWSVTLIAAVTAAIPLIGVCSLAGASCRSPAFAPLSWSLIFASVCGALFLWWSSLRHQASRPGLLERVAAQSPAVKLGLIFIGAYAAVAAAAAAFVAASGGDMAGLVFLYVTLPWSLAGLWLGGAGMMAGVLLGLVLNAAIAFAIGYGLARSVGTLRE